MLSHDADTTTISKDPGLEQMTLPMGFVLETKNPAESLKSLQ